MDTNAREEIERGEEYLRNLETNYVLPCVSCPVNFSYFKLLFSLELQKAQDFKNTTDDSPHRKDRLKIETKGRPMIGQGSGKARDVTIFKSGNINLLTASLVSLWLLFITYSETKNYFMSQQLSLGL